jgi:hypothetical protein
MPTNDWMLNESEVLVDENLDDTSEESINTENF